MRSSQCGGVLVLCPPPARPSARATSRHPHPTFPPSTLSPATRHLSPGPRAQRRQSLDTMTKELLLDVFATNAVGPLLVVQQLRKEKV